MHYLVKALTQKHLDIQFSASNGLRVQITEFPGRWMQQDALQLIVKAMRSIASKSLADGDLNYGVFSGDPERMKQSIITLIRDRQGRPLAFNALAVIDTEIHARTVPVLHLGLVMVDPDQRSKGMSWILYGLTCFLLLLRNGLRAIHISSVTQVPSVVGLVSETFANVYPTPANKANTEFQRLLLARSIMAHHRHVFGVGPEAEFDEHRFVITNAYTGGSDQLKKTFSDAPKHRDNIYNEFCRDTLDYGRGDDLLQIGEINLTAATHYVRRQVPRGSLLGLVSLSVLVLLRQLVLPVFYWFDSRVDFGKLRPAK